MGASFRAHAAIGCKVPIEKAKRKVQIRGCQHEIESLRQTFCPYCGHPTWITTTRWILPYNEEYEEFIPGDGLKIISSTGEEELVVAALWTEDSGYDSECEMARLDQSIDAYKTKVQTFLEPLRLWDESLFGLWIVPF